MDQPNNFEENHNQKYKIYLTKQYTFYIPSHVQRTALADITNDDLLDIVITCNTSKSAYFWIRDQTFTVDIDKNIGVNLKNKIRLVTV